MKIIGAGLAGCLAGVLFPDSQIYEAGPDRDTHKSLLRFRTNHIGKAVGIPFKKVRVYKSIWHNDSPVELSPRYIALYSRKVSDTITYRSICNLDTAERYIAHIDFLDELKNMLGDRVHYNADIVQKIKYGDGDIISTIPINVLSKILGRDVEIPNRKHPSIYVNKYIIPDCDVYMTYYYTSPNTRVYRASITGNELIIESNCHIDKHDYDIVIRSFGLTGMKLEKTVCDFEQKNGKIVLIDDNERKRFIVNTTLDHGIYSLGRLATWRNILLDDVFKDINLIKEWTNKSQYDRMIKK